METMNLESVSLFDRTKALLGSTKIPVAKICRDLNFSQRWYYRVMDGDIKDPGVNRIQRLHDYLLGQSGEVAND